jgi:hypothetical protein
LVRRPVENHTKGLPTARRRMYPDRKILPERGLRVRQSQIQKLVPGSQSCCYLADLSGAGSTLHLLGRELRKMLAALIIALRQEPTVCWRINVTLSNQIDFEP